MNSIIAFDTISRQFTTHRSELMKLEFDVNASAAATVYVQLHDFPTAKDLAAGNTAPAVGAVPIKSWPTPAGAIDVYKEFKNGELDFSNGVFACVSTTQATLTIGTGSNKFDSVAAELWNTEVAGTTTAQGSGLVNVQVWSEAVGVANVPKLRRFVAVNLEAGVRYLMLFARNTVNIANNDKPIRQWTLAATGDTGGADTLDLRFIDEFNEGGLFVRSQSSAGVNYQGCSFVLSTTATILTKATGAKMNVWSEYK